MKEPEYYTPSMDEFHVGFEYEYKTPLRWVNMKMDSLSHRPNGTMALQYDLALNKDKFRVKYLTLKEAREICRDNFVVERYEDGYWRLICVNAKGEYYGMIKNKSQLRTILKMMGHDKTQV